MLVRYVKRLAAVRATPPGEKSIFGHDLPDSRKHISGHRSVVAVFRFIAAMVAAVERETRRNDEDSCGSKGRNRVNQAKTNFCLFANFLQFQAGSSLERSEDKESRYEKTLTYVVSGGIDTMASCGADDHRRLS